MRHRINNSIYKLIHKWIREGRGVAIWESINLSDPSKEMMTPGRTDGKPTQKPHWGMANAPSKILEVETDFEVCYPLEVKRFHVGTRMGAQGLMVKVTDAGSRRIRSACEAAGDDAWHEFDYGDYKNAVIMKPGKIVNLEDIKDD